MSLDTLSFQLRSHVYHNTALASWLPDYLSLYAYTVPLPPVYGQCRLIPSEVNERCIFNATELLRVHPQALFSFYTLYPYFTPTHSYKESAFIKTRYIDPNTQSQENGSDHCRERSMKSMYRDFGKSLIDPKYCCCGMSPSPVLSAAPSPLY